MALGDEIVKAGDPKEDSEEPEEEVESGGSGGDEDDDEDELIDPKEVLKAECQMAEECAKVKDVFMKCEERVPVNPTIEEETCEEELYSYVHCVDACVARTLFSQLK